MEIWPRFACLGLEQGRVYDTQLLLLSGLVRSRGREEESDSVAAAYFKQ